MNKMEIAITLLVALGCLYLVSVILMLRVNRKLRAENALLWLERKTMLKRGKHGQFEKAESAPTAK